MATAPLTRIDILSRTGAAVLGGYAFSWGVVVIGIALMYAAGMEFHDAEHLAYIIGLLVFLGVFLSAFAARSVLRVWAVLLGGGALMTAAASLIQSQLV